MKYKGNILLFIIISILISIYYINTMEREYTTEFTINKGDSLSSVIRKLDLPDYYSFFLKLYFMKNRTANRIMPKKITINGKLDIKRLHDILISPAKVRYNTFTILPGERWKEVRQNIMLSFDGKDPQEYFEYEKEKYEFLSESFSFEGFLGADTYYINAESENRLLELLELALEKFRKDIYEPNKDLILNGLDFRKLCILSSIVEKEGRDHEENRMIAGVFFNRLKKDQALESCATVQYILEKPKERLYNKDIAIISPYNTYLNKGLPPGPICFFNQSTFEAVREFKKHDYYYFVLKKNGKHHFSRTLAEHNRNK